MVAPGRKSALRAAIHPVGRLSVSSSAASSEISDEIAGELAQLEVGGRHSERLRLRAAELAGAEDLGPGASGRVMGLPVAQPAQAPQPVTDETSTRSPTLTVCTSGPTSATVPTASWPMRSPSAPTPMSPS